MLNRPLLVYFWKCWLTVVIFFFFTGDLLTELADVMPSNATVDERTVFSALTEPVSAVVEQQKSSDAGLSGVVVCGLEAHGSVLQTALDLLRGGTPVYVPIDCVASRPGREADFDAAIQQVTAATSLHTGLRHGKCEPATT